MLYTPNLCPAFQVAAVSLTAGAKSPTEAATRLQRIFDEEWQRTLKENPTQASQLGDRRYNRFWPDTSLAAIRASQTKTRQVLAAAKMLDPSQLAAADRFNLRLFEYQYEADISEQRFQLHLLPVNQRGGIQDKDATADLLQFDTLQDYDDWIARLRAFPVYTARTMALMRQGIQEKMLHPKIVMQRVPAQIRKQLVSQPQDSSYYKPFRTFTVELTDSEKTRLRRDAAAAIESCILPSYRTFLEFFETEYLPACFDDVGCWQRPNGQAMYAELARRFTTTSLTPQEIHDIGLAEVTRIRVEMEAIRQEVGFQGSFQEFLIHLRTDRQFYFDTPTELLQAYRECCDRINPNLPKLFLKLPKSAYDIRPIPDQMAPDTTTAYYRPPAADGTRPGSYFVNLYRPETRPKFEIDALSLHESVPGHHLQIALSMELTEVPEFRRHGGHTAFIEGWALYTEKLGGELGLYRDPYSRFGQLTYEMWRAVRLVVDTGMHSLKWSRQEAIDFFASNTAKSMLDIENEVDRYIAWPGQALAYKIGELRIRELRQRSEQELGSRFDVREFHDVVLRNGAVPLDVLDEIVTAWIAAKKL
jgi:prolyl oligopeptidase